MGFLVCFVNKYNRRLMEDKLVTLAILTYAKAQILKNVLENEGIETYIHNVNQIQPVVSSGVRVRIKESNLPHALKITESSAWLSEEVVGEKMPQIEKGSNKVLIPVDFSSYSLKACEFGFNFAKNIDAEVVLLHVYFTPIYATSLPYGDVFNYQLSDEENVRNILQKVHSDLNALSDKVKAKVTSGEFPDIKYTCVLREGIPEEEILRYSKENRPRIIIMGTHHLLPCQNLPRHWLHLIHRTRFSMSLKEITCWIHASLWLMSSNVLWVMRHSRVVRI